VFEETFMCRAAIQLLMGPRERLLDDVVRFMRLQANTDQVAVQRRAQFLKEPDKLFTMAQILALLKQPDMAAEVDGHPQGLHRLHSLRRP
jgi:hypothetical protein